MPLTKQLDLLGNIASGRAIQEQFESLEVERAWTFETAVAAVEIVISETAKPAEDERGSKGNGHAV